MKPIWNPSLMCMDFMDMKNQLDILNKRADMYHFDIMDGHFVPNITLSPDMAKAMAPYCEIPMDFHLMVEEPAQFIDACAAAVKPMTDKGIVSYFCPHAEVISGKAFRIMDQIHAAGFKTGVVLNPETPLCMVESYLQKVDKITILSVDPGFAGQPFIPEMLDKIAEAKALREANPDKYHYIIEIDGSCNKKTFKILAEAGVESFIVGSSGLFNNDPDLVKAWDIMADTFDKEVNG
ncbi:MAG: D-allulose 6-phosphate 3-epimerase [Lachnospiraceae bacterium]|nr:D-allulose 6-phosphate 3-epimerase [Lachnospiraceae bacterium]